MTEPIDNTRSSGSAPSEQTSGVLGGDAERLDSPGEGAGGVPAAGADGVTAEREHLRKDLGERAESAGEEGGADLEQAAAIGETDDPRDGSLQEHGGQIAP